LSNIKTKRIEVIVVLDVTLDESKFTDEVMNDFNDCIGKTDMAGHFKNLAFQEANGFIGFDNFVEGYGDISDLGVEFREVSRDQEIIDDNVEVD
jgi:hypothetical protein